MTVDYLDAHFSQESRGLGDVYKRQALRHKFDGGELQELKMISIDEWMI